MALKNCPECQKQISDSADICVGCGIAVKKCPECGNLVRKDDFRCETCGFQMLEENVEEVKSEKENISSEVGAERLLKAMDKFKDENPGVKRNFWYSHRGRVLFSSAITPLVLIAVFAVVELFSEIGRSSLSLGFFRDLLSNAIFANLIPIILGSLALNFLVWSPIGGITNATEHIHTSGKFYEYCDKNGVDLFRYTVLASYIITTIPKNKKDTSPFALSIAKDAVYYAANPEERRKYKVCTIIDTVLGAMFSVVTGSFAFLGFVESLITKIDLRAIYTIWKLPSAFVFYAVGVTYLIYVIVSSCVIKKSFNDKRDAWIAEQATANISGNTEKEMENV